MFHLKVGGDISRKGGRSPGLHSSGTSDFDSRKTGFGCSVGVVDFSSRVGFISGLFAGLVVVIGLGVGGVLVEDEFTAVLTVGGLEFLGLGVTGVDLEVEVWGRIVALEARVGVELEVETGVIVVSVDVMGNSRGELEGVGGEMGEGRIAGLGLTGDTRALLYSRIRTSHLGCRSFA